MQQAGIRDGSSPEQFISQVARESWDLFKDHAVTLILAWLLAGLLSIVTLGLAAGTLAVGYILLIKRLRRGEAVQAGDVMHFGHFVGGLIAFVVLTVGVSLGMCLLVLPGLLLALMWTFTFHAMAYEDLTAIAALRTSWSLVKGAFLHSVVLVIALTLLNSIAGAVVLASVVSVPFSLIAMTVGYEILSGAPPAAALPAGSDSAPSYDDD